MERFYRTTQNSKTVATSPSGWTFEPLASIVEVADWDHVPTLEGVRDYLSGQAAIVRLSASADYARYRAVMDALTMVYRRINA